MFATLQFSGHSAQTLHNPDRCICIPHISMCRSLRATVMPTMWCWRTWSLPSSLGSSASCQWRTTPWSCAWEWSSTAASGWVSCRLASLPVKPPQSCCPANMVQSKSPSSCPAQMDWCLTAFQTATKWSTEAWMFTLMTQCMMGLRLLKSTARIEKKIKKTPLSQWPASAG